MQLSAFADLKAGVAWCSGDTSWQSLSTYLACARNHAGDYSDKADGTIQSFGANVLLQNDTGLRIAEARTNLAKASEDLTNTTYWAQTAITGAAAGTFNSLLAFSTFTEDTATSSHRIAVVSAHRPTLTAAAHTLSFYVRAGTRRYVVGLLTNNIDGAGVVVDTVNWTIATGTVGNGLWTIASSSIAQLGSTGTYRVTVTINAQALQTAITIRGNNANTVTLNGTYLGDGSTFKVAGVQLELGSFATSYIKTTTATDTRPADVISLTGAAATAALAAKAARFETNLIPTNTAFTARLAAYNGGALLGLSNSTTAQIGDGAGNTANGVFGSGTIAGVVRSAFGFDATSMTAKGNGGATSTSAHPWINNTGTVTLGDNAAANRALNGLLTQFAFSATKGDFDSTTGTDLAVGLASSTLGGFTGSATGATVERSTGSSTVGSFTEAATGATVARSTGSSTTAGFDGAAAGAEVDRAAASSTLGGVESAADGATVYRAAADTTVRAFNSQGYGEERNLSTADQALQAFDSFGFMALVYRADGDCEVSAFTCGGEGRTTEVDADWLLEAPSRTWQVLSSRIDWELTATARNWSQRV